MPFFALTALFASGPATSTPPRVFTVEEVASLSEETKQRCGYASPQDLMKLSAAKRQKILPCFIQATVKRAETLLPKTIEPGAAIVSVSDLQGFPVFVLRFAAGHPRALVPKNQTSDYDDLLSTRTCNDKWLGSLIDAGMVDGAQAGAIIVYKIETEKNEVLAMVAVAQCFDPK
jgi:hypothetical protein